MKKSILFAALLCLPLCLMAGKRDYMKNPKYLLGAVPEVEGIVTFQKSFSVTDKSEKQIYDVLQAYISNSLVSNAIHDKQQPYTRIISEEKESGTIVARIEEYMTFTHVFLNLDRTRFRYLLSASVKGQKVNLVLTQISYYYNEDMDGKNGITYKAEEWITDKLAVNKKGTKLYPRSGKFRYKTVDRVEEIFKGFVDVLSTKQGVVED
ncbi:MAG: DUF4468 domain-containing protein [Bacteroidaceae bacterium]|nr:DUF4468 domain-containing protein [Bacteroidaceae bacterium]